MNINELNEKLITYWEVISKVCPEEKLKKLIYPLPFSNKIYDEYEFICIGLNPSYKASDWYEKLQKYKLVEPVDIQRLKSLKERHDSIKDTDERKKIRETIHTKKEEIANQYFTYESRADFNSKLGMIHKMESDSFGTHDYFERFRDISVGLFEEGNKHKYLHLDLFNYKVTSSGELLKLMKEVPKFFYHQLLLFKEIFDNLNHAKIILVANADAARIFKRLYFNEFDKSDKDNREEFIEFLRNNRKNSKDNHAFFLHSNRDKYDDKLGYYKLVNRDRKVFFSGMLSGGHLGSDNYDRLKKDIINSHKK